MKDKSQIINEFNQGLDELISTCHSLDDINYFQDYGNLWNIAENIDHLILSIAPLAKALSYPKFIIWLKVGKSNRTSRTYDEVINSYRLELENGGKATGPYVPKSGKKYSREKSLHKLKKTGDELAKNLNNWSEKQLDQYLLPHPLLGKITTREMLYFTVYHNYHHLEAIKKLT